MPSLVRATEKAHIETTTGKIIAMFRYVLGPVSLAEHPSGLTVPIYALHPHKLPALIDTLYGTVINQPGFEKSPAAYTRISAPSPASPITNGICRASSSLRRPNPISPETTSSVRISRGRRS